MIYSSQLGLGLTQEQIEHHASEIAIIGLSDICQCVRNFSVQALFFGAYRQGVIYPSRETKESKADKRTSPLAAKHIIGIGKKLKLWNVLVDIEVHLGFSTRNRIKRLEQLLDASA